MSFGRKPAKKHDPLAALRNQNSRKPEVDTVFEHETQAAELFGGKRHRGSGASPFMKSDASSERYQIECKQTVAASMSVKLEWLKKIVSEATGRSRTPALHIKFLREMPGVPTDWVLLPAAEVDRLLREAGAK